MSTARTTPAQKPRGRTRKSTFPLVFVGIFFLSEWFIKTLSYLRGGVSWMEIGGSWTYIEERPASESRPYKNQRRGVCWMEIGGWGSHRRAGGFGPSAALGIKK